MVDPASIARCCIENGQFPTVLLFFQYPCSISDGWSEWVDYELKDLSTCDILCRAGMLDVIFLSKPCNILIEAEMLRHVVRRRGTETHFYLLEDAASIFHLPICGNQDPFNVAQTHENRQKLEVLRKGAPTAPSTSLQFSNWILYSWDANRNEPCRLATLISLWLGKFIFCDFSQDYLHEWFRRMQRNGQNFLELLDDVENFIFRPYCVLLEEFKHVPLYSDSDGLVEAPVMTAEVRQLRKEALLSVACLPLPTLGDEGFVHYSLIHGNRPFFAVSKITIQQIVCRFAA
ncbi:PREDICTED: Receptor cytosolic serine/threonine-kinase RBK1 [Prunus dulcis]|uniref:PREDICTED: Receptor cytosolic serine/threonine-kinase RBK1 n=1 Tax=Prunus dulcis TaxID=3755 RepID=A0A5E4FCU3_PRUDU|nr:PREDICTED: Receptor cytosolic serine/threonine-kinase RBK1 [Prunus dulcis]